MRVNSKHGSLYSLVDASARRHTPLILSEKQPSKISPNSQIGRLEKAVVKVMIDINGGYTYGSGIVISPSGEIVTAYHVLELPLGLTNKGIFTEVPLKQSDGSFKYAKLPLKIKELDKQNDTATLTLPRTHTPYQYAHLAEDNPTTGDLVFSIGFPQGVKKVIPGCVIYPSNDEGGSELYEQMKRKGSRLTLDEILFIDKIIGRGNVVSTNKITNGISGGGLFNTSGQVCAVVSGFNSYAAARWGARFQNELGIDIDSLPLPLECITISKPVSLIPA